MNIPAQVCYVSMTDRALSNFPGMPRKLSRLVVVCPDAATADRIMSAADRHPDMRGISGHNTMPRYNSRYTVTVKQSTELTGAIWR